MVKLVIRLNRLALCSAYVTNHGFTMHIHDYVSFHFLGTLHIENKS